MKLLEHLERMTPFEKCHMEWFDVIGSYPVTVNMEFPEEATHYSCYKKDGAAMIAVLRQIYSPETRENRR